MVQAVSVPKQSFSILKIPVSRDKQVLYYYKPYIHDPSNSSMPSLASPPPSDRTIYVVHFLQQIEESFLLKTFSAAGKIKKTIIGSYTPKRAAKRAHKKRVLYYALVVFKTAEAVERLGDSKFLQKKINAQAKKNIGFSANPFLKGEEQLIPDDDEMEEDMDEEEKEQRRKFLAHKRKVEA